MAVKFSQFTSTTDPTAIEKVVGYTTAGSVNFQIPTANLDTTYLITSPETVSGRIDLTLTGTKAGVSSTDVVEITSGGNIALENTTDGFRITGGVSGVTSFTNINGTYVSATTANTTAAGNVTVGTLDLSAVNGTSDLTTRFLSQDNTWDLIDRTTGTGTVNKVPLWTTTTNLGDSVIAQSGANIGIGTTTPADKFSISSSTNQIGLDSGDIATYGTLDLGMFTNGAFIGTQAGSNAASDLLRFGTNGTPRMTITSAGNVGIGTTSPNVSLTINATDAVQFPAGTTTNRNAITTPANGMLRYSTTDNSFEGYINGAWGAIGGGVSITKEQKTGNGTTTDFTLTTAAGCTVDNLAIYISGVYQNKLDASGAANFTVEAVANPTLQFVSGGTPTAPPVTSTNGIEIVITR